MTNAGYGTIHITKVINLMMPKDVFVNKIAKFLKVIFYFFDF